MTYAWKSRMDDPGPMPSRDQCPTCNALRDEEGRLCIGFCGPSCLVRKWREARRGA